MRLCGKDERSLLAAGLRPNPKLMRRQTAADLPKG
jgi:hypothetical protein